MITSSALVASISGASLATTVAGAPANNRARRCADTVEIDRRVGKVLRLFRRRERLVFAARAAHPVEIERGRQPVGLRVAVGADDGDAEHRIWLIERLRRPEVLAVAQHRGDRVIVRKMMREREPGADHAGKLCAVAARAEQPDRRQRTVGRHRMHVAERMTLRKGVALEQDQFLKALQEIVVGALLLPAAQRIRRHRIGARRAAEAEIDAAGE